MKLYKRGYACAPERPDGSRRMNKLDKTGSISDLLKAGATVEQCQLTAAVCDALTAINDRLAKIERDDAVRSATRKFVFESPVPVNGAMHALNGIPMTATELVLKAHGLHVADKGHH